MKFKPHYVMTVAVFMAATTLMNLQAQTTNVGIGTTNPAEKLEVAGNVKADTLKPNALKIVPNAGSGKVLTSDASGNATWKSTQTAAEGFGSWGDCVSGISEYQPVSDSLGGLFGNSVSISGNYAIVGDPYEDVGGNNDQGSASIFQFTGGKWVFMQKITDATGQAYDYFGKSVSISGARALVGIPDDDVGANADQGSALLFVLSGNSWLQLTRFTDPGGAVSDHFGASVSINDIRAIIGSPYDDVGANVDQGSACIFHYQSLNWVLKQKVFDATGETSGLFGYSVSINDTRAIIGSPYDDVGANGSQGSATIYTYNGSTWAPLPTITDPGGATIDHFGWSVSISGNYAIVGANNDDDGANTDQGSACIFWFNGAVWEYLQKMTDPDGAPGDLFGSSVSISGNYAIVGAFNDDVGANTDQGSATIYTRVGGGWQKIQFVTDPGGAPFDKFGVGVAIDGTNRQFVVGAPGFANCGKAVFGKVN